MVCCTNRTIRAIKSATLTFCTYYRNSDPTISQVLPSRVIVNIPACFVEKKEKGKKVRTITWFSHEFFSRYFINLFLFIRLNSDGHATYVYICSGKKKERNLSVLGGVYKNIYNNVQHTE